MAVRLSHLFCMCLATAGAHPINQDLLQRLRTDAMWQTVDLDDNPFATWDEGDIKGLMGTILDTPSRDPARFTLFEPHAFDNADFPAEFDARTAFPKCRHPIRDQKHCGSCWAFSTAETWADNACILKKVPQQMIFSTQDLLSCDGFQQMGCHGGRINYAFDYVKSNGLVSEACLPYSAGNGTVSQCPPSIGDNKRTCSVAGEEWTPVQCDKKPNMLFNPALIKAGITQLGAVSAGFIVYEDFMHYKSGVYKYVSGKQLGGHAIKVIGWGVQNGTQEHYWWVANSWNASWGLDGYFKFSMADTKCALFEGGAYNCGQMTQPPVGPPTPSPSPHHSPAPKHKPAPGPRPPSPHHAPAPKHGPSPAPGKTCKDTLHNCGLDKDMCNSLWNVCLKTCGCCNATKPSYCKNLP